MGGDGTGVERGARACGESWRQSSGPPTVAAHGVRPYAHTFRGKMKQRDTECTLTTDTPPRDWETLFAGSWCGQLQAGRLVSCSANLNQDQGEH